MGAESVRYPGLFAIDVVRFRPSANISVRAFCCRSLSSSVVLVISGAMLWRSGSVGYVCIFLWVLALVFMLYVFWFCVFFFGVLALVFALYVFVLFLSIGGCGKLRAAGISGVLSGFGGTVGK